MRVLPGLSGSPFAAIVLMLTLASRCLAGDTGGLAWTTFDEGVAAAQRLQKKILIDVYTDWCGWCKRMDSQTYANPTIQRYLREKFVLVKLDAESGNTLTFQGRTFTEREFAGAFGITGYPSTLFLTPSGEAISIYPGFADATRFGIVLSYVAEDHYRTTTFEHYLRAQQ